MTQLYHAAAYFKDGIEAERKSLAMQWNEHLRQDHPHLKLAGMLISGDGVALGVMTLIAAETLQQAQGYFDGSPYQKAGLYGVVQVCELSVEVGSLT